MGTVGAVAVDVHGNVASATSTGGMLNKMEGRVGDTPCVGKSRFSWTRQNRFILCEIAALHVLRGCHLLNVGILFFLKKRFKVGGKKSTKSLEIVCC